jgi:Tfp pilus assembly protein PilV
MIHSTTQENWPKGERAANHAANGEGGFTLLETAIAAVLLMVVGLGVAGLFVYAIGSNGGASDRASSLAIAQGAMEKLRALPFTDADLASTGTTSTTATVNDGSGRSFQITTTIADTVINSKITLKKITIKVVPKSSTGALAAASGIFGSVTLVAERCTTVSGTNIN